MPEGTNPNAPCNNFPNVAPSTQTQEKSNPIENKIKTVGGSVFSDRANPGLSGKPPDWKARRYAGQFPPCRAQVQPPQPPPRVPPPNTAPKIPQIAPVVQAVKQETSTPLKQLSGQVKFTGKLGQGEYGEVFIGKWNRMDKGKWVATDIACKRCLNTTRLGEFKTEAMIHASATKIPHPNVVQFYGMSGNMAVTEFCNGGNLKEYLQKNKLTQDQKQQIIQGVVSGMSHLAKQNIVHRDLAARNILIHEERNGKGEIISITPKITDFGFSRNLGEGNYRNTRADIGPLKWMAPELLKEMKYSTASDVFSFVVLVAEILLDGQEPYEGLEGIEVAKHIQNDQISPMVIIDQCPGITHLFRNLMYKCCEVDPEKRPAFAVIERGLVRKKISVF